MITFFTRERCGFCERVKAMLLELKVEFEEVNINEGDNRNKLVAIGGKEQVPFIVDGKTNKKLYEEINIANYLSITYGTGEIMQQSAGGVCSI